MAMAEELQFPESPPDRVRLKPVEVVFEIFSGLGIALGLSILWVMEVVRDAAFYLLDRANVQPRTCRASAFPPGQPRKRSPRRAR